MCEVMRKYEEIARAKGYAEGFAEGMAEAEGRAEVRVYAAKKLIGFGNFTDEQISELTGLSVEEIAAIRSGFVA